MATKGQSLSLPIWLTEDLLQHLSRPKGQKAVMGMRYFTGSGKRPFRQLVILYDDGSIEWTHTRRSNTQPPPHVVVLQEKARKAGLLVTGEAHRVRHHWKVEDCPICLHPLRLCLCNYLENE
jgi:hypothetical protein